MLELAILGLLKEQDLHGYELKKRLGEMLGVASGVSFGSLYPALGRLERSGAVRTVDPDASPAAAAVAIPQTGSLGGELAAWRARGGLRPSATRAAPARAGRSRKVYGITARGEVLFGELLAAEQSSGDDSRLFHLRLAFARHLSADARLGMLERRRAHLLDRLSRSGAGGRGGRRLDGYVRSLMEHDREATEHDLSWIERLIARERGEAAAGAAPLPSPAVDAAPAPAPFAPVPSAGVPSAGDPTPAASAGVPHSNAPHGATDPVPARAASGTPHVAPRRHIAPPTLAGIRPDSEIPRHGRDYQEESHR